VLRKTNDILTGNIQREMLRNDLDYNGLAKATGLTRSGIYKIVKGLRWPTADNLDRIARALKRDVGWLFTDHDLPKNQVSPEEAIEILQGHFVRKAKP
jgi:transcriptional regulator with XRE-family HTH domain